MQNDYGLRKSKKIVLLGGGNGAHVIAGLAAIEFFDVCVLTRKPLLWKSQLSIQLPDEKTVLKNDNPIFATDDPSVVSDADIIILCAPIHVYPYLLDKIKDHLPTSRPIYVGTLFGQGGFHWMVDRHLNSPHRRENVTAFAFQKIPWTCRTTIYGESCRILGAKRKVRLAVSPKKNFQDISHLLAPILKVTIEETTMLSLVLTAANNVIHPGRYFGIFHQWDGTTPYNPAEIPLLYEDMDEFSARTIEEIDRERYLVVETIRERYPDSSDRLKDVKPLSELTIELYGDQVKDTTSLQTIFATNAAYRWFKVPVMPLPDGTGVIPDHNSRLFHDDIPFGLCIIKDLAELLELPTPMIDKVISWHQRLMGKEYIVGGKLRGRNVSETPLPSQLGFDNMNNLLGLSVAV